MPKRPKALVTSGPTHEPIDPVRFIGNRSSGKQGHAIAAALAGLGFEVTLVTGPVTLPDPKGVTCVHVSTAKQMLAECLHALPVDVAVCAAAVGDWQIANPKAQKIKKDTGQPLVLTFTENPDILHALSTHLKHRPKLVVGFAAETEQMIAHARQKLTKKKCDWIMANNVADGQGFDADDNQITWISHQSEEAWPKQSKAQIAAQLATKIQQYLTLT